MVTSLLGFMLIGVIRFMFFLGNFYGKLFSTTVTGSQLVSFH